MGDRVARRGAESTLSQASKQEWVEAFGAAERCLPIFRHHGLAGAAARHLGAIEEVIADLESLAKIRPPDPYALMDAAIERMAPADRERLGPRLDEIRRRGAQTLAQRPVHAEFIEGLVQAGRCADAWALVDAVVGRGDGDRLLDLLARLGREYPAFLEARPDRGCA
ncbi:MAG: hypothetical protein FJ255_01955 [Phycisphaerae bacterium]|nr:hypothetical protein [Phycisphaerae bacterium]